MSYVERLVASPLVACTWEQATATQHEQHIVPDACVDLIWAGGRLTVAGPDTRARVVTLESGSRVVGARLRPGAAGAILALPASELCDVSPDATVVLGRDVVAALLEELAGGSDPRALLLRAVQLRGAELDPLVRAAVVALGRPRARVAPVARLVDRHRYSMLFADGPAEPVVEALRGYRNPDGGFGHALEPDLRGPGSQPAPTLYALEILNEAGAADGELARGARGWIAQVAEPDGGIPSVLPGFEDYPHAAWFQSGPGSMLTLALAAALHAGGVTDDAWLDRATDWCWRSIETADQPGGYWLKFACAFLDAVPDEQHARAAIASLSARVDTLTVAPVGGVEGEALRPLDLSPRPASRSRGLIGESQIEAHLDAVESEQQQDGGWTFDWLAWSPAQTTDWRGNVTLRALIWLRDNGRL